MPGTGSGDDGPLPDGGTVLDDLKSFFTNSSVAEVGVGVTIGAAFAGLVGAATEARSGRWCRATPSSAGW